MNEKMKVKIAGVTGLDMCAAAGRISTKQGTASEIFSQSVGNPSNANLIHKVLSSGHRSVMEHCVFNIIFENVSVFVEQFMIEFRLASFTVQSRRYVDFGNVGRWVPESLDDEGVRRYNEHMDSLFALYNEMTDAGIPKEDARFVLPYCFHSNFFVTCNARELLNIILAMLHGRGKVYPEIRKIGECLAGQFEEYFPGEIEAAAKKYSSEAKAYVSEVCDPAVVTSSAELVGYSGDCSFVLASAERGFVPRSGITAEDIIADSRPRELELLNFTFDVKDISLSTLTHFSRHRMQTLIIPNVASAVMRGHHILPQSIENSVFAKRYMKAFSDNAAALREFLTYGNAEDAVYFAMSGNTVDIITSMNGREFALFCRLRTCSRAQWEIRNTAVIMLDEARRKCDICRLFGPSCFMTGVCPEGRMTCGKIEEIKKAFSK